MLESDGGVEVLGPELAAVLVVEVFEDAADGDAAVAISACSSLNVVPISLNSVSVFPGNISRALALPGRPLG